MTKRFDEDDDDEFELSKNKAVEKEAVPVQDEESPAVIPETPCLKKTKADFWLLKEKHGPSEVSKTSGRKMRQTKLELGTKRKESKVDLSKLASSSTANQREKQIIVVDDEEIIALSPDAAQNRVNLNKYLSSTQDSDVNTTEFKPLASSTQKPTQSIIPDRHVRSEEKPKTHKPPVSDFDRLPTKVAGKESGCTYVGKKKSERQQLEGWDCKDCAEYYAAMGKNLNSAELKERMNACSRHRNKHKPQLNDTPPGFWNPLFPSTEEVKGYESVRARRN